MKNFEIELEVIDLSIVTHVVLKGRQDEEMRMFHPRTAHARSKKNSKRENRTMATRSAINRLTVCANRASSCS